MIKWSPPLSQEAFCRGIRLSRWWGGGCHFSFVDGYEWEYCYLVEGCQCTRWWLFQPSRIQNELALGSSGRDCGRGIDCDTIDLDSNGLHTTVGELQVRIVFIGVLVGRVEILLWDSGREIRQVVTLHPETVELYVANGTALEKRWSRIGVWGCFVILKLMGGLEMRVLLRQFPISWEMALLK